MQHDLYRVLGAASNASADDLRRAYQRATRRARSDQQMRTVGDAYAILGDPRLRTAYDRGEVVGTGHGRYAQRGVRNPQPPEGQFRLVSSGQPAMAFVASPPSPAPSHRRWSWGTDVTAWRSEAARTRP